MTESAGHFRVGFDAHDGSASVRVDATVAPALDSTLFVDLDEASTFFEAGCVGLSPARDGTTLEGLALETSAWSVEPLDVVAARSTYFDDPARFPPGSIELDHGLMMRDVPVRWHVAEPAVLAP